MIDFLWYLAVGVAGLVIGYFTLIGILLFLRVITAKRANDEQR